MRVSFVCEGLNKLSARAQPWKHVVETARRIQALGNDVHIISDQHGEQTADDEIDGLQIRRVGRKLFLLNTSEVAEKPELKDADIINWHGSDAWSCFYLSRLGKLESPALVWTLHSGPVSLDDIKRLSLTEKIQLHKYWNNLLNSALPSRVVRRWFKKSKISQTIALSERLLKHLAHVGLDTHNVTIVRSGVDTKGFKPSDQETARENLHLPIDDPIILYYGPLSSFRGVDTLVAAMPAITMDAKSAKLLLLGRGAETNMKSEKIIRDSIEIRTEVLSQDVITQYLAAADLVVLPFKFWPQVECPLTILESMAVGRPVISTYTGAIPEIIESGKNGILVQAGDPSSIAVECVKLLKDSDLRFGIGENARRYVERFFDWDEIVKQTLEVFTRCS